MKAGLKKEVNVRPAGLLESANRWRAPGSFITDFLTVPRGHGASQRFWLRDFQSASGRQLTRNS